MPIDPEFRRRQIYGLLVVAVLLLLAGSAVPRCTIFFRLDGGGFGKSDNPAAVARGYLGSDR